MAGLITHIAVAEKVFKRHFNKKNKSKFFIGSVFPDIRLLGGIDREKTHLKISSLEDVKKEKTSFIAGVKFHDLTDWLRNQYLRKNSKELIKSLIKNNLLTEKYSTQEISKLNRISKLLEDELIYSKVSNWQIYINYLDNILPEQIEFGVEESKIFKWHKMLQNYFHQPRDSQSRKIFLSKMPFWTEERIAEMEDNLQRLNQVSEVHQILIQFYDQFDNLIKDFTI